MNCSRRQLLTGAGALAISQTVLPQASAASGLLDIAILIGRALWKAVDEEEDVRWKTDTSKKLDDLVNKSASITDELKQMNIVLKKQATAFSDFIEIMLRVDVDQFEISQDDLVMYQQGKASPKFQIQLLIDHMERDVLASSHYGPAAYHTTYAAAVALRAVYKYANYRRNHQNMFFANVAAKYRDWLDREIDGTPANIKYGHEQKIREIEKEADGIVGKYKNPRSKAYIEVNIKIAGDLDKGFTVTKSSKLPDWFTEDPQSELDGLKAKYDDHVKMSAQLANVVSQLDLYRGSLLAAAKGGRLAPV